MKLITTPKAALLRIALFLMTLAAVLTQSHAGLNADLTNLVNETSTFFTGSVVPFKILIFGFIIAAGFLMAFLRSPKRA